MFTLFLFPLFSDKSLFPLFSDKSPPSSPNQIPLPSALTNESHKTTYQTSCQTRGRLVGEDVRLVGEDVTLVGEDVGLVEEDVMLVGEDVVLVRACVLFQSPWAMGD